MSVRADLERLISTAISERAGSSFVQALILVTFVALGATAGVRALGFAVSEKTECAGAAIETMTPGLGRCAAASGSPRAGGESGDDASEASNILSVQPPPEEPRTESPDSEEDEYSARAAPDVVIESQEWAAVTDYIADEVETNIDSDEVDQIRDFNDPRGYVVCFPFHRCMELDNPVADALGKRRAYEAWADLVGPEKPWDHKAAILDAYGQWIPVPGEDGSISFDVWSNIHYGIVGRHAGFSGWELHLGANAADVSANGSTNQGDQTAIQIGIDLYEEYGEDVTAEQIREAVIEHYDELGDEGKVYGDPDYEPED